MKKVSDVWMMEVIFTLIVAVASAEFMYVDNERDGLMIWAGVAAVILWLLLASMYLESEVAIVKEKEPCGSVVGGLYMEETLKEKVEGFPED